MMERRSDKLLRVRNKAGVTEILHKHESGVHWLCVVISFHNGITIYCDSLAWPVPSNLHLVLVPFFHALCDVFSTINKAGIRNQEDVLLAHNHGASNVFEESCLSYLPFQGHNMNVCGLACLLSCILLSEKDYLEMLLNKKSLPTDLSWLQQIDQFDEFVRKYRFVSKQIDRSIICVEIEEVTLCNLDAMANFSNDGDAFRANVDTYKDIGNNDFLSCRCN